MTYHLLITAANATKSYDVRRALTDLILSAAENATDTVFIEKEADEAAWEQVFYDSLVCLLSDGAPKAIGRWFRARGVAF